MYKILVTAKREYIEHVKTKGFIIGILIFPIMLLGSGFLIEGMKRVRGKDKLFTILDPSGIGIADAMLEGKEREDFLPKGYKYVEPEVSTENLEDAVDSLNEKVNKDELFSFFVVAEDPLLPKMDEEDKSKVDSNQPKTKIARYYSKNLADEKIYKWCKYRYSDNLKTRRIEALGISVKDSNILSHFSHVPQFQVKAPGVEGGKAEVKVKTIADDIRSWLPVAMTYILWIAIMIIAQTLLTNTIEEKSNRIFEVLLSSMSPFKLMVGKILGIAGMGLTMLLSWFACFLIFFNFFLPQFTEGSLTMEQAAGILTWIDILYFVIFFVGGFFVYSSIYMSLGSVCNTIKDAQNLVGPITIVMIIPFLASFALRENPNTILGVVLSYIPFFTPFIMMSRATAVTPAPLFEIVLGIVIICATVCFSLWAAGKIFRVGILMTGKPPKIREVVRWLRAK